MEKLFRLGHEPALTMGNAKAIDVLVLRKDGKKVEVSVKAIRGGGKWGLPIEDESKRRDRVYVLLHYSDFEDPAAAVNVFVVPAPEAEHLKERWFAKKAIYCSNFERRKRLEKYRDAWHLV